MKKALLAGMLLAVGFYCTAAVPRIVEISGKQEKIKNLEIVTEQPVPVVDFAAKELQTFLKQATGQTVPIVKKGSGDKVMLVLGDCPSARAAGIDVSKLPDEGYYIVRKGKQVFLAGRDDRKQSPAGNLWKQVYQRGTLSAVYDFLERFAGVRFFFAGPHGTVVPVQGSLSLPEKINILERPDMSHRDYYHGTTKVYPGYSEKGRPKGDTLERVRLRFSELLIPYGHGLCYLELVRRFGKTHPEYFALMTDGRRCKEPDIPHTGHLCYNSGIREEIYQDAKAFLTGKTAASRGLSRWNTALGRKGYFNIMPQDWLYWCGCEKCRKIAEPGRKKIYSDPKQERAAGDFLWEFTVEVANRLKKDGIKGGVAQMAYRPYSMVPKCDIPDNVRVMAAVPGLGADKKDTAKIRAWKEKLGRKIVVWTYVIGKHMNKKIAGIPPMLPRHIGQFIDANKEMIDGGFWESQSDYYLFQYLNYYVLAKKTWNNSLDTEKLLDDHYRSMFGKGAPMMKKFYEALEDVWGKKILGNTVDTGLGPVYQVPSDLQIWTEIYSPAKMKEFNALFDAALKAAAKDKGAVQRIRFIRQNLFGPLEEEAKKFALSQAALDSWIIPCPGSVWLRPFDGEVNEVSTKVTAAKDKDHLIFTFDCEEPRMADLKAAHTERDDAKTYEDSDVEIMINPSGDRKNYYQFVVNANGALTDYRWKGKVSDRNWNSSATAQAVKRADGWSATVKIPLKDLGEINPDSCPVNFCRHRALKGNRPKEIYYQWSPLSGKRGGFHVTENWGRIVFKPQTEKYLLHEDYSSGKPTNCWRSGGVKGGQICEIDDKVFISAGKSLHFKNIGGMKISSGFKLPAMKPNTKYRLSYFLKTANLKGRQGAGAFLYFNRKRGTTFPNPQILGTNPWHRLSFEFTTPADTGEGREPILGLWIWSAEGEAWFDEVKIEEIK